MTPDNHEHTNKQSSQFLSSERPFAWLVLIGFFIDALRQFHEASNVGGGATSIVIGLLAVGLSYLPH